MCRLLFFILFFFVSFLSQAESLAKQAKPLKQHDHVLAGHIYDVKNNNFIEEGELFAQLSTGKYILLGETHDNIRHHQIQKKVMQHLAQQDDSISVSFEMLDSKQVGLIGDINSKNIDELMMLLKAHDPGWGYDAYYKDLFDIALQDDMRIYPANIERQQLINIMRNKTSELMPDANQLMLDTEFTNKMEDSLREEIVDSHCGMLKADSAGPMITAQRVRDITMALSLINAVEDKRVLLAGSGHIRNDRGVPIYLAERVNSNEIRTLAMLEVEQDVSDIASYAKRWDSDTFPFDYVWLTVSADREDPCLAFQSRLKSHE